MVYGVCQYDSQDIRKICFFIERYPFSLWFPSECSAPVIYTPLMRYIPDQKNGIFNLFGHLDNNNPALKCLDDGANVRVIFMGPNGYISPRDYVSTQYPTWNYSCVEICAKINFVRGESQKCILMERQINYLEKSNAEILDRTTEQYKKMLSEVVFFTLTVTSAFGRFKFSQEKPQEDRMKAIKRLEKKINQNTRYSLPILSDLANKIYEEQSE